MLQCGDLLKARYQIQQILGHGSIGVYTYAAIDKQENVPVIIKELVFRHIERWKTFELFEREAQALASLDHPRIPKCLDYFKVEANTNLFIYLIMTQMPGKSLAMLLDEGWRSSEQEARIIADDALSTLAYLHEFNPPMIHRDVKPSNLLLDKQTST